MQGTAVMGSVSATVNRKAPSARLMTMDEARRRREGVESGRRSWGPFYRQLPRVFGATPILGQGFGAISLFGTSKKWLLF